MNAELELRKATCACAPLTSVRAASAAVNTRIFLALEVLTDEDHFLGALDRAEGGSGTWIVDVGGPSPVAPEVSLVRARRRDKGRAAVDGGAGLPACGRAEVGGEKHE